MQALKTPENAATRMPLPKLNSLIEDFFASSHISRSLDIPASPVMTMPRMQTRIPMRMTSPEVVPRTWEPNVPSKIGGTSVPTTAQ